MGILTLGIFYFTLNILEQEIMVARTTALVTLIFFEIANAFNFRSFRKGVLNRSLFVNKYLVYASIISILATLIIVYTPVNKIFETAPIPLLNFIMAIAVSFSIVVVFDVLKKINKKNHASRS